MINKLVFAFVFLFLKNVKDLSGVIHDLCLMMKDFKNLMFKEIFLKLNFVF